MTSEEEGKGRKKRGKKKKASERKLYRMMRNDVFVEKPVCDSELM